MSLAISRTMALSASLSRISSKKARWGFHHLCMSVDGEFAEPFDNCRVCVQRLGHDEGEDAHHGRIVRCNQSFEDHNIA